MFRSLHVGIDRYADPGLQWLSGAVRDAEALHALFADTFGTGPALLCDKAATASGIRTALVTLASEADDVVVVTFAGHGTEDHYLVPYDADTRSIPDTCIGLAELAGLLSAIPGATLFCALDCCFSGGLGARVFSAGVRARVAAPGSAIDVLSRFTGNGRIVLTASSEDQPAMESARHGHGLLTFRLLEALQGAPEVRRGDQVDLYQAISYVTRHVEADAAQMGHHQTPAMRGRLDGAPLWPVLTPGSLYAERFPARVRQPATADLDSLDAFGIPAAVRAGWAGSIPALNGLQLAAINDYGVLDGENLVVTAPTSSGKTMIGELAALQKAPTRQRAVFLLPMRALVNDKYEQFTRLYGLAGIHVIRATGEHSDQVPELLRGQFDIALLTYEKFAALTLAHRHLADLAATVIVDEAQILADPSRGSNLEFLLTLLNQRRGMTASPQVITLSAVVGDIRGLDRWLGGRHLNWDTRPVPLVEGVLDDAGTYRFRDESGAEQVAPRFVRPLPVNGSRRLLIPLVQKLLSEDKKVVIFRESRGESVACSVYLARSLGLAPFTQAAALDLGEPSASSRTLRDVLRGGVAFHNSDLSRDERRVIEEAFRDPGSALKVIVATPTLAMGVNTPAAAVAIVGLTHPGPVPAPYTVAEYKNMVGRAGRLGFTGRGESYLIPSAGLDPARGWNRYVNGQLEALLSQLVPDGDPRTLMLRVLASHPADATGAVTEDDVIGFLDASFAAFQAREGGRSQWHRDRLRVSFQQLASASLVSSGGGGFRLTELGRFTGESGVHVDSIIRLVHGLRHITGPLNSVGLVAAAQLTNELNQIYLPVNATAKNTEVPRWPNLLAQQGVPGSLLRAIQATSQDAKQATTRAKRAAAAAMWISGLPMDQIETHLNQHLYRRGGLAGTVRSVADRTRDLLPAVAAVIRTLHPGQPVDDLTERTMLRLELGLPADLVELAGAVTTQLTRPQWLKLRAAGLSTIATAQEAAPAALTELLNDARAAATLQKELRDRPRPDEILPLDLPLPTE
jgi:ATP-dependent DNA helicase